MEKTIDSNNKSIPRNFDFIYIFELEIVCTGAARRRKRRKYIIQYYSSNMRRALFIFVYIAAVSISSAFRHRANVRCISTTMSMVEGRTASLPASSPPQNEDIYEETTEKGIIFKRKIHVFDGYDARFMLPLNSSDALIAADITAAAETAIFMEKFRELNAKKQLLSKLEDATIPQARKLEMLPLPSIRPARINIETLDW